VAFTVSVPAEATVYVNGKQTTSTGTTRRYVSRGLAVGRSYTFNVRAEYERDGEMVSRTKVIQLQSGQEENLAFDFDAEQDSEEQVAEAEARTKLTLHVPADAKVYLSGHETKASGQVREFATSRLSVGETWDDYLIRVEIQRDGQTLSKEQKLSLVGGEERQLTFNFAQSDSRVARLEK